MKKFEHKYTLKGIWLQVTIIVILTIVIAYASIY